MAGVVVVTGPTVLAGQSLSSALDLTVQGQAITGIIVPDGLQAGYITFQLSQGPSDFRDLWGVQGGPIVVYTSPGARMVFNTNWSLTADWMKIRLGSALSPIVTPVNQVFKTILFS